MSEKFPLLIARLVGHAAIKTLGNKNASVKFFTNFKKVTNISSS